MWCLHYYLRKQRENLQIQIRKLLLFTGDPMTEGSKMTKSLERVDPNPMENQRILESPMQNVGTVIRLGIFVKTVKSLRKRRRPQILVQKNLKMMAMLSLQPW
jgi:hypothetical protein